MTPRSICLVIAIASIVAAAPTLAQTTAPDTVVYGLATESDFAWGCFDPCACPIIVIQPLLGTFKLSKSGSDPLFDYYSVDEVRWNAGTSTVPIRIMGSGTYTRGGEVALQQEMTLDLSFNGQPTQRFDSGRVPVQAPWPEIRVMVAIHDHVCLDSVINVVAKPLGPASVDGAARARGLTAIPNPFRASTEMEFSLAHDGRVDLGVFDLTGREVRSLARREWITAGRHRRDWDGLLANGAAAPAGLYFVRLETAEGVRTREVVKLR